MKSKQKVVQYAFLSVVALLAAAMMAFQAGRGGERSVCYPLPKFHAQGAIADARISAVMTGAPQPSRTPADARLSGAYRFDKGGWVYVHLEGNPGQIGFQHGYLLAPEITD